jgi:hypothetical protein
MPGAEVLMLSSAYPEIIVLTIKSPYLLRYTIF